MKLVVSMFCVGALSLVGCVDQEVTGGGQLEGMRPAKPSLEELTSNPAGGPLVFEGMNQNPATKNVGHFDANWFGTLGGVMLPPEPAREVCENCMVTAIKLPHDDGGIDEVRIVSDGGLELCRIYLNDGQAVVNECGTINP